MADDDFLVNNPNDINPLYEMKKHEVLDDDDTPFSSPDGIIDHIDDTHPLTDSSIDSHQRYDEGIEGAAEANLSHNEGIPASSSLLDDDMDMDETSDDDDDSIDTPSPEPTGDSEEADEEE